MKSVNEYLSNISPSIKEKFKKIKFIVFDFDGVFTDNQVYIQGLSSKEKLIEFIKLANEKKFNFSDIAYMGNDINDIDCLKKSGLAIVVNDSHPEILKYGDYKTDTNGGHGPVREVCDIIEALNN